MSKIHGDSYMTTGEFAEICGATKHTLFHYDEIGLLKPELVDENGYRYYSIHQTYTFDIINILKQTGTPLKEIKVFLEIRNTSALMDLLRQKIIQLKEEERKIKRMRGFLDETLHMTEEVMNGIGDYVWIEECKEQILVGIELDPDRGDKEFIRKLTLHRKACEIERIDYQPALWSVIKQKRFMQGHYFPDYIGNRVNESKARAGVRIKPAGFYAVANHKGSYETMPETHERIKNKIEKQGFRICGDAYSTDLLNYLAENDPNSYVIRIWVHVCQE